MARSGARLLGLTRLGNGSNPRALDGCHQSASVLLQPPTLPYKVIRNPLHQPCFSSWVKITVGGASSFRACSLARDKDRCVTSHGLFFFKHRSSENIILEDAKIVFFLREKESKIFFFALRERNIWSFKLASCGCV